MGNSGSHQTGNASTTHTRSPNAFHEYGSGGGGTDHHHQGWTTASFPRAPYPQHHHKLIVPDRDAHQRLRPTGNGEILHAGGTISGRGGQQRQQQQQQQPGINRSSSIPTVRTSPLSNSGQFLPHSQQQRQVNQQQKTRPGYRHNQSRILTPSYRKDQIKRFGSEPDLRAPLKSNSNDYNERYRGRKKYKAPPPPQSPDPENYGIETGSPIRRARLFKTRAETKKKLSSPVHNHRSIDHTSAEFTPLERQQKFKSTDTLFLAHTDGGRYKNSNGGSNSTADSHNDDARIQPKRAPIPQMQRTRSSPEFQAELMQVTRRLVSLRRETEKTNSKPPLAENKLKTLDHSINKKDMRSKLKELQNSREMMILEERTPASGKESTPEMSPPKVKTFYFGMDQDEPTLQKIPNSIDSEVSSDSETETATCHDISLQLRPILPKKQLEIPRFSPSAAWKLLSAVDTSNVDSTLASEDGSVFLEERIEKLARAPPPYRLQTQGQRSNHDKSGDSGISGDETPEALQPPCSPPKQRGMSWTPQQDLGDDSSLEDVSNLEFPAGGGKFPTRPHVFSLSLPRDNHLAAYINEKSFLQPYSSLQKLKRSVSGVLATLAKKEPDDLDEEAEENWFLSRSAPNSLNNGFNSLEMRRAANNDVDHEGPKQTRRIMYLPHSNLDNSVRKQHRSQSFENVSTTTESRDKPQDLQDPPNLNQSVLKSDFQTKWTKKPKKFTFQSTVRQIERKRLADKLSKEAERKEQQRRRELEAMQRVEEEFQKKRAREKATIRQQLRLYSMDDTAWSSLPPNLEINNEITPLHMRAEPDGAVSSTTSSPTFKKNAGSEKESKTLITRVLSEFRQPQREYKEFRSNSNNTIGGGSGGTRYADVHATTVHPRVTCNMPKATVNCYDESLSENN